MFNAKETTTAAECVVESSEGLAKERSTRVRHGRHIPWEMATVGDRPTSATNESAWLGYLHRRRRWRRWYLCSVRYIPLVGRSLAVGDVAVTARRARVDACHDRNMGL